MRTDLTDITILLDRSGSMSVIQDDTIGGFNTFLGQQKNEKSAALLSLIQFDDQYEVVYSGKQLNEAAQLSKEAFVPRGSTALYDAICRSMDETGKRLENIPEADRPGLVVFAILTDGYENASAKYTIQDVNERIAKQRDQYNWQILFLGANQDAIAEASKMGINRGFAMSYGATSKGVKAAIDAVSANLCCARSTYASTGDSQAASACLNYTDAQRKIQEDEIWKKWIQNFKVRSRPRSRRRSIRRP